MQVLDRVVLPVIDPASQNQEQQVPGFKKRLHTSPNANVKHAASGIGGCLSTVRDRHRMRYGKSHHFSRLRLG
jgi:hypothetical protein